MCRRAAGRHVAKLKSAGPDMLADAAPKQALGDGASLFGELVPEARSRLPDLARRRNVTHRAP